MTETIQDRAHWENEYASGQWSRLLGDHEFAHYAVVAGFIQRKGGVASLLDIGCGEGVILKHLNMALIGKYTGVDLAQAALDRIAPRRSQDEYICSSLESFTPTTRWDVILFNEVLYYTADPVAELRRFEDSLTPEGRFVISMYRKRNPFAWNNRCIRSVWRYIRRAGYTVEDAVELSKKDGSAAWQVYVVRPA